MRILIVVLLVACGGKYSQEQVEKLESKADADNGRLHDEGLAATLRSHDLAETTAPPAPQGQVGASSGTASEEIVKDSTGADVLVIASGCNGNTCSCDRDTEYHWATDHDGALYLVRLHTQWHVRTVHQNGACGFGCGVPQPAEPDELYALPPHWGGFVDGTIQRESIDVVCDQMIPAP